MKQGHRRGTKTSKHRYSWNLQKQEELNTDTLAQKQVDSYNSCLFGGGGHVGCTLIFSPALGSAPPTVHLKWIQYDSVHFNW